MEGPQKNISGSGNCRHQNPMFTPQPVEMSLRRPIPYRTLDLSNLDRTSYFSEKLAIELKNRLEEEASNESCRLGIYKQCCGRIENEIKLREDHGYGVHSVQLSTDAAKFAIGMGNGGLKVFTTATGTMDLELIKGQKTGYPITAIRFHPNISDLFYACTSTGTVLACKVPLASYHYTPPSQIVSESNNEVNTLGINSTGTNFMTGGKDTIIRVYDTNTLQMVRSYSREKSEIDDPEMKTAGFHRLRVMHLRYHLDEPHLFISGSLDQLVKVWDCRTQSGCVQTIIGPKIWGHTIDVRGFAVLTGSWRSRDSIQVWDLRRGTHLLTCNPNNSMNSLNGQYVSKLAYFDADIPNVDLFTSALVGDNSLKVISIKQNIVLHSFPTNGLITASHSIGPKLVFGGLSDTVYIGSFFVAGEPYRCSMNCQQNNSTSQPDACLPIRSKENDSCPLRSTVKDDMKRTHINPKCSAENLL